MRYRLRTLLILLAILPPVIAVGWWQYSKWRAEVDRKLPKHMPEEEWLYYHLRDVEANNSPTVSP